MRNGKVILVEVKSHVDREDVYVFKRKTQLYENSKKPDRLLIVTPYADEEALETASKLGVEVYTSV